MELVIPSREVVTEVVERAFRFGIQSGASSMLESDRGISFLDISTTLIPLVVEQWRLKKEGCVTQLADLCLAGAVRTTAGDEFDSDMVPNVVGVFQECPHPRGWPHRSHRTDQIVRLDKTAKGVVAAPFVYMVMIFRRGHKHVCTLLSPWRVYESEKLVVLMVNKNNVEVEY